MSLLFLYNEAINPITGGVERTTYLLAEFLESRGYIVYFLGLNNIHGVNDKRQFILPNSTKFCSPENVQFYRNFLIEKSVKLVINKGGTNIELSELAIYCKVLDIRLITAIHNSVLGGAKNFSSTHKKQFEQMGIGKFLPLANTQIIKWGILLLYKWRYKDHYRLICKKSDLVILESEKQKEELEFFLKDGNLYNVIGIPNFIIYDGLQAYHKEKDVLFVGRINTTQKRVDLLLKIWDLIHKEFPNWKLKIVGGGEELNSIKELSVKLKLRNVFFYGYTDAKPYYESASIICLTSSYEGFGLTLVEAMQHGVVPIAFNSYLSVTDIIDDKINGYLISPFDINEYANTLAKLMNDEKGLKIVATKAKVKARKFDLSIIGERWVKVLKDFDIH